MQNGSVGPKRKKLGRVEWPLRQARGSGARSEETAKPDIPIRLKKSAPVVEFSMPLRADRFVAATARKSLGQRLGKVSDAWERFQDDRGRHAVYGYLSAVFALVKRCGGRRRTRRLVRRAFKFAGLPIDKAAERFTAVTRCTSDGKPDNKTISKWARALRYVARVKRASSEVVHEE